MYVVEYRDEELWEGTVVTGPVRRQISQYEGYVMDSVQGLVVPGRHCDILRHGCLVIHRAQFKRQFFPNRRS